jgi:hypothetical protein
MQEPINASITSRQPDTVINAHRLHTVHSKSDLKHHVPLQYELTMVVELLRKGHPRAADKVRHLSGPCTIAPSSKNAEQHECLQATLWSNPQACRSNSLCLQPALRACTMLLCLSLYQQHTLALPPCKTGLA